MKSELKLGTRSSKLSMAQTDIVVNLLTRAYPKLEVEVVPIKTLGDRLPPEKRASIDEKSAFTQDIEDLLISGVLDVAVHSMKDLPNEIREGLVVAATPARDDARDALVSSTGATLHQIAKSGRIGTSSLRRKVQLLRMRKDIEIVEVRGNVETRLAKIAESGLDGVVLASAGLKRIGESDRVSQLFSVYEMIPAICQGVLAVESRSDDVEVISTLSAIDDPATRLATECERAFGKKLGGNCDVPLGAYAEASGGRMSVTGMVASPDGAEFVKKSMMGSSSDPEKLGAELADSILASGGRKIMEALSK